MEKSISLSTNVKRGILLFSLACGGCSPLAKINEGLCIGGGYAPEGSSASLNDDKTVNLITLRRSVEIIPSGNNATTHLVKVGDTVYQAAVPNSMKAGDWAEIKAKSDERISDFSPKSFHERNPMPDKPFGKELTACVDKYGNVHYKNH